MCLYDICSKVDKYNELVYCVDPQTVTLSYYKEIQLDNELAFIIGEHRCYVCFMTLGVILRTDPYKEYLVIGRHKCIVNGTLPVISSNWKDTIKTLDTVA